MPAIEVADVTKTYGEVTALDSVTLAVEAGSTVGLLGTNGAGKTTLFSLLVGHQRPDSGALRVAGLDPGNGTAVRRQVGYLPETAGFPASLTGREVLEFHADVRDLPAAGRETRIDAVLETVGLADAADRRVGGYSKGMNRRLGLATALLPRPAVLLLDEPTAGLDPRGVDAFHDVVADLTADDDITILFSSHSLAEVEALCEEVAILADGTLRAAGPVRELRAAAADGVTVWATLADPGAVPAVREAVGDVAGVREVTDEGDGALTVACERDVAYDVVGALHEAAAVERFEVREPGLSAAFRRAIGEGDAPDTVAATDGGHPGGERR